MSDILRRLFTETWPAKAAQSALHALMLPGQVAGGELAVQPSQPGMWSDVDEARSQATQGTMMDRAADLGGLLMGGGFGMAPAGSAGMSGARLGAKLPMDERSRMIRAAEQGYDTSNVLYHGTSNVFDEFTPNRGGVVYLTDRPEIAEIYSKIRNQEGQKAYAKSLGRDVNADPSIMPVFAKRENPIVISDKGPDGSHGWLSDNLASALGVQWPQTSGHRGNAYRDLINEARKRGHDMIEVKDMLDLGGAQTQFFVLSPDNVRSKFAEFNPSRRGTNKILGAGHPLAALMMGGNEAQAAP